MKKLLALVLVVLAIGAFFYFRTATNFLDCEFKFNRVAKVVLSDVDITNANSIKKIGVLEAAKLFSALNDKNAMMDIDVELAVSNPNDEPARLDGLDYILYVDNREVVNGNVEQQMLLQAGQSGNFIVPCHLKVNDVITSNNLETLIDFARGLATDNVDASRLKVAVKPYFTIAGKTVKFPSYVTIEGNMLVEK